MLASKYELDYYMHAIMSDYHKYKKDLLYRVQNNQNLLMPLKNRKHQPALDQISALSLILCAFLIRSFL